ncbi:MAG: hypothetical protein H6920_09805 [Sphingomonadaceae bacterium]|nr:hypothetical protein [Novosphingobium sp.]MCP5391899.1 hypothetical protein [Sphingomonadaceae bacterium]
MSDLSFDPSPYRQDVAGIDLPLHEVDDMIVELHARISLMVDLLFGDDPTHLACEKNQEMLGGTDAERAKLRGISANQESGTRKTCERQAEDDSKET